VLLLLVLALLAIVVFGVAFTAHWLFVIAAILAVVWLVSFVMGSRGGRTRGAWR
jgi:phosphotransferase system  glucose/maltose/N-acetylglucosamine-specific IIC component